MRNRRCQRPRRLATEGIVGRPDATRDPGAVRDSTPGGGGATRDAGGSWSRLGEVHAMSTDLVPGAGRRSERVARRALGFALDPNLPTVQAAELLVGLAANDSTT